MAVARARSAINKLAERTAVAAGSGLRFVSLSGASAVGALLISYGLGQIFGPLGWISVGVFVLLADRKRTVERKGQ